MSQFDRKAYMRDYQREWIKRRRDEWIEANGPCRTCNGTEGLQVDHIDWTTKTINPTRIWSRREDVRQAELLKCQVLCIKCHEEKTRIDRLSRSKPCGTWQAYSRGCRCRPCTDAEAAYARARRSGIVQG